MSLSDLLKDGHATELSSLQASGIGRIAKPSSGATSEKVKYVAKDTNFQCKKTKPLRSQPQKPQPPKSQSHKSQSQKCRNCGRNFPHEGGMNCPAASVICCACSRTGHFERWCLSKTTSSNVSKKNSTCQSKAYFVKESDLSDEEMFLVTTDINKPSFKVCLNGTKIKVNANNCSSCNLTDMKTYNSLRVKPVLEPTNANVFAYGPGMFYSKVEWRSQEVAVKFYVVPTGQTPILSVKNSQISGMLHVAVMNL